MKVISQTRCAH